MSISYTIYVPARDDAVVYHADENATLHDMVKMLSAHFHTSAKYLSLYRDMAMRNKITYSQYYATLVSLKVTKWFLQIEPDYVKLFKRMYMTNDESTNVDIYDFTDFSETMNSHLQTVIRELSIQDTSNIELRFSTSQRQFNDIIYFLLREMAYHYEEENELGGKISFSPSYNIVRVVITNDHNSLSQKTINLCQSILNNYDAIPSRVRSQKKVEFVISQ